MPFFPPKPVSIGKRWHKQTVDRIKIYVDGTFFFFSGIAGAAIGVVARDHHGMVMAGLARRLEGTFAVELAEAVAFIVSLEMAQENGWSMIDLEGNLFCGGQ
ncbi:hypothetical protein F3Y22_tig00110419pilonHSYRG00164 [Hibiscus syriacus]|uniref:RNase H type-1 domain-containing protein n=1 Tax=Hibiscus syriacus TaxID=106335 RepID=A0A6A3AM27_HIBSY|nr:hypothetical protein F3Y22_tig00110419pilonHSYRG00164 [Hibiscus syriacus]